MKHFILSISLLFSCVTFSQDYIPILEEGNSWSVDVYYEPWDPPGPPYSWTITEQISLGDLEEVNGLEYYRVWSGEEPTCLLREENGIVYKYDEYEEVDKILFDFTLEEGDTFNLYDSAYNSYGFCSTIGTGIWEPELHVDTVEEIEIAGELRKVITFLENGGGDFIQFQWIEGIGNITGFDLLWGWLDIGGDGKLVCFTTYDTTYFFNDANSCDNTTLSLGETDKDKIVIYPNPISERSILHLPNEAEIDQLKIYNLSGVLVKEVSITSDNYILNNMDFASGLYFYQVSSNGKHIKTEKFIVK